MELQIKADLTQTLCIRQMHELIEIDIREDKKFTCLFIDKDQAKQVIAKLQECVGETSKKARVLPISDVINCATCKHRNLSKHAQVCYNCNKFSNHKR